MNTCYDMNMNADAATALDLLRSLPGVTVHTESVPRGGGLHPDALVSLRSGTGESRYVAVVRSAVTTTMLPQVLPQLERLREALDRAPLLLAPYLTPGVTRRLVDEHVEFADGAGNVFLDGAAAYVLVLDQKRRREPSRTGFSAVALQLIYAFLVRQDLLRATYRELSDKTGVSLGKISTTVRQLEDARLVARGRSGALLMRDARELLGRWEVGYLDRLRPRLAPTRWRLGKGHELAEVAAAASELDGVLVGGEHAADAFLGQLRPGTLTLHVPEGRAKHVAVDLRVRPADGTTDVVIIERFATLLDSADPSTVRNLGRASSIRYAHPLLVRAELLALDDNRLRQVAARLLEELILPSLTHAQA